MRQTDRFPPAQMRKVPEMKTLLLVLGGAWFFISLLFVFALAVARAKPVPPIASPEVPKPVPEPKRQRKPLAAPISKQEEEPVLVRSVA